jgi:hypothetical protein
VGPRADVDDGQKRKYLTLLGLELRPLSFQPVASRSTAYVIPAPRSAYVYIYTRLIKI